MKYISNMKCFILLMFFYFVLSCKSCFGIISPICKTQKRLLLLCYMIAMANRMSATRNRVVSATKRLCECVIELSTDSEWM